MVLAGDGEQNAASVKFLDYFDDARSQLEFVSAIFDKDAVPKCVVEVPDDTLYGLSLFFSLAGRSVGCGFRHFRFRSLADEVHYAEVERGAVGDLVGSDFNAERGAEIEDGFDFGDG